MHHAGFHTGFFVRGGGGGGEHLGDFLKRSQGCVRIA